jgi:hypothetical protein
LTQAEIVHGRMLSHTPFELQVCMPLFVHCVWPATHSFVQRPAVHVAGHASGLPH